MDGSGEMAGGREQRRGRRHADGSSQSGSGVELGTWESLQCVLRHSVGRVGCDEVCDGILSEKRGLWPRSYTFPLCLIYAVGRKLGALYASSLKGKFSA